MAKPKFAKLITKFFTSCTNTDDVIDFDIPDVKVTNTSSSSNNILRCEDDENPVKTLAVALVKYVDVEKQTLFKTIIGEKGTDVERIELEKFVSTVKSLIDARDFYKLKPPVHEIIPIFQYADGILRNMPAVEAVAETDDNVRSTKGFGK